MKTILMVTIMTISAVASDYTMTPDGKYVEGDSYVMTPKGTYVSGDSYRMTPDGNYVGHKETKPQSNHPRDIYSNTKRKLGMKDWDEE